MRPIHYILIGFVLVLAGVAFPFLMVIGVIQPSLWLNFVSYGASVVGLFLGMWGAFSYVRIERRKKDQLDEWKKHQQG
ncbi:MAG: hypothetical protein HPY85_12440 [Anaerolineae bacterium]|nr:hypothetical protein [Anaerolineae bacterium]